MPMGDKTQQANADGAHVLDKILDDIQETHSHGMKNGKLVGLPRGQQHGKKPSESNTKDQKNEQDSKGKKQTQGREGHGSSNKTEGSPSPRGNGGQATPAGGSGTAPNTKPSSNGTMNTILTTVNTLSSLMGGFNSKLDLINTEIKTLKEGQGFLENQMLEWQHQTEEMEEQVNNTQYHNEHNMSDEDEEPGELIPDQEHPDWVDPGPEDGAEPKPLEEAADCLADIRQDAGLSEPKLPPITESWAAVINKIAASGLHEQGLKDRKAKIVAIENLEMLVAPRLNDDIWNIIPTGTKTKDSAIQSVQKCISGGLAPIIKFADSLSRTTDRQLFKSLSDGIYLILAGHSGLNTLRRDLVKPELNQNFKSMCASNCPVTTNLFGDDVTKRIKDIGDVNRAGMKLKPFKPSFKSPGGRGGKSSRGFRPFMPRSRPYVPYQYHAQSNGGYNGRPRGRGSFLESGHPHSNKPGNSQGRSNFKK